MFQILTSILNRANRSFSFNRLNTALVVVTFILTLLLSGRIILTGTVLAPDSFLHLAVGKYIGLHKEIPEHYDISYKVTEPSLEWISHGWLGDLLLYILTAPDPESQSIFLTITLVSVLVLSLYASLRQLSSSLIVIGPTIIMFIFVSTAFWKLHPLLFIMPLYTLQLYIMTSSLKQNSFKRLLFLPIIAFLWAQLYGGYLFIFFITVFAYLAYAIIRLLSHADKSKKFLKFITLSWIGSLLTSLVNPLGLRIYVYWISFFGITTLKQGFSSLTGILTLVNQNIIKESVSTVPYAMYLVLFVLVGGSITYAFFSRKTKLVVAISHLLPLTMLGLLPFVFIKLLPFGLVPLLFILTAIAQHISISKPKLHSLLLLVLLLGGIPILAMLVITPYRTLLFKAPQIQSQIIISENLPQNIFTSPEFTGYIAYKTGKKMNVDLLDDVFDETEVINLYLESGLIGKDRLQNILKTNTAGTVLVAKEGTNIAQSLNAQFREEWAMVYIDKTGFLFVNRDKVTPEFIKEYELRTINLNSSLGVKSDQIEDSISELEHFIKRYPSNTLAAGQLATLYRITKSPKKAEQLLFTIPQKYWDYTVLTELGRVQASLGRCELSEQYFLQALNDRSEQNYSRTILDIAVVYAGCLNNQTKARHFFERYLSFPLPQTEKDKARTIAEDFGINLR